MCDHNASIANSFNRGQIAMSWLTLKTLYGYFSFEKAVKAIVNGATSAGMDKVGDLGERDAATGRSRHPSSRARRTSGMKKIASTARVSAFQTREDDDDRMREDSSSVDGGSSSESGRKVIASKVEAFIFGTVTLKEWL